MLKKLAPALFLVSLAACSPAQKPDAMMEGDTMMGDDKMMEDTMMDHEGMGAESVTFVGKSNIVDHPGHFMKFSVDVLPEGTTAETFANASVKATIDLTSVATDSKGVDGHLQREDFFDTANYPEAVFVSKAITRNTDGTYAIAGDMTIKGVTKPAVFTATVNGNVATAQYDLPRQDFGVGNDSYGNKLLDALVPVEVVFHLDK